MAGSSFKLGRINYSRNNIVSSGGTTTLLNNSDFYQYVTGTLTQTIQLPDATTMKVGMGFSVINANSSGGISIVDNGSNSLLSLPVGRTTDFILVDKSTTNGIWMKLRGSAS